MVGREDGWHCIPFCTVIPMDRTRWCTVAWALAWAEQGTDFVHFGGLNGLGVGNGMGGVFGTGKGV